MNILVVLRNLYNNPDPFDEEMILGDSDINAISEACELRDKMNSDGGANSCKVTSLLFSERESDYRTVLIKAASYGADEGIHVPVDNLDFSDSNVFSRLIASVIRDIIDKDSNRAAETIVLFGRLAYDGDSVNIATQTAENLEFNRAIYSKEVTDLSSTSLTFKKALDDGAVATTEVPLPAVIHSIRRAGLRRQAKIADIIRAYNETEVKSVDLEIVSKAIDMAKGGPCLTSPIQEIPPYISKEEMQVLNGTSDVDTSKNIIDTLKNLGFEPK